METEVHRGDSNDGGWSGRRAFAESTVGDTEERKESVAGAN